MSLETIGVSGPANAPDRAFGARRILSFVVRSTILLAMFLPASLVAVSLLKMLVMFRVPPAVRQGWYVVSAGQAAQFAGAALILFLLVRRSEHRQLSEMACSDGASPLTAWWYVHLPRYWPILVGSFILVLMLCMTELSATMVLLPAGVPSFAQWLLNQMHYVRDQHVIASCLMLVCLFVVLAAVFVLLMRVARLRRQVATLLLVVCMLAATGCERRPVTSDGPGPQAQQGGTETDVRVLSSFGRTGRGRSEFIYPRAIDLTAEGSLFVVDKTGRIQRLTPKGDFQLVFNMPNIEAGKPTGISIGPDSNLYVADTHCHRVVVFSPEGDIIRQFGTFGQDKGCFIYPTDVAFAPDGTIFVSEYGGNDRISVFTEKGDFLHSFGSPGSGDNQFLRPSALCVDKSRRRLYIADACNQRIAVYDLGGNLQGYIGAAGRGPGQLRYPYDLALLADGTLVVCEFGNNRLQLFNTDGDSVAIYGGPGRQLGQLAYPWGVAVDQSGRAFVVDAGNNRIQIWQL
jgi:DNA-binding beta-propeller fold protein YncE/ABC-type molybdate transport system permease subunit